MTKNDPPGKARRELSQRSITCISDEESDICVTTSPVRLTTGSSAATTIHLAGDQLLSLDSARFSLQPYPRKTDAMAMQRTSPVILLANHTSLPTCDVTHPFPAVVFSTGGFAGNFFHDINDVLIPLFLTSGLLSSHSHLVVTDYESWWFRKYRRVLDRISSSNVVIASSSSEVNVESKVHCFPAAVVGLKYHGNLACNPRDAPGTVTIGDFRRFLRESFQLKPGSVEAGEEPVLVLISRRKSRVLLNEEAAAELAREVGFRVEVATPERMSKVEDFAATVGSCSVLMGVHGAGLTNVVFLRRGAVLLQVVPWGLDWAAGAYYGGPARAMEVEYVEYHVKVEESTLSDEYPSDHPVIADPWGVNLKGYNVSKPVYTDGQNVRLDLERFRPALLKSMELLRRPASQ